MQQIIEGLKRPYIWSSFIIVVVLIVFSIIIGRKVKKLKIGDKPPMVLAAVISLVAFINGYVKSNVGKQWKFVAPHILAMSIFLFVLNISGLFTLNTPTRYTTITVCFAIWSFILVQVTGIRSRKIMHLETLVGPIKWMSPIMVPLNLLSDLTPLISMTLRIFGNIASGALLMSILYKVTQWAAIIIAPPFHLVFDIGFGLIQTLVFVLLTVVFVSNKLDPKEFDNV